MVSEINNLGSNALEVKGPLKAFGVATSNIVPGPDGVAPLSRQGAFKKEEILEDLDLQPAAMPAPLAQAEETTPISVADPSTLGEFKLPDINQPVVEEEPLPVVEEKQPVDIELPVMPDSILAQEPTGTNDSLFATSTESAPESNNSAPIVEEAKVENQQLSNDSVSQPQEELTAMPGIEAPLVGLDQIPPLTEEKQEDNSSNKGDLQSSDLESFVNELIKEYEQRIENIIKMIQENSDELKKRLHEFVGKKRNVSASNESSEKETNIPLEIPSLLEQPQPVVAPAEPVAEAPAEESDQIPALDVLKMQGASQTPQTEIPTIEEESTNISNIFPPVEHDNLVEDALHQISNMPISSNGVDDTPIQGKFI